MVEYFPTVYSRLLILSYGAVGGANSLFLHAVVLFGHADSWKCYVASVKTLILNGHTNGNPPLWFLSALFLARILFNVIVRHARLVPFALLASALVAAACVVMLPVVVWVLKRKTTLLK